MRLILEKKGGEVSQEYDELMGMLEDGKYLVTFSPLSDLKTIRGCQNQYFLLVDLVSAHSGETKYELHEDFKEHRGVETTKNFSLQDWVTFIDAFKWKQFNDYDLIL